MRTGPEHPRPQRDRLRQLGWLLALWAAGVVALGLVAAALRLVMRSAGFGA